VCGEEEVYVSWERRRYIVLVARCKLSSKKCFVVIVARRKLRSVHEFYAIVPHSVI
jgi:hypothetical protein